MKDDRAGLDKWNATVVACVGAVRTVLVRTRGVHNEGALGAAVDRGLAVNMEGATPVEVVWCGALGRRLGRIAAVLALAVNAGVNFTRTSRFERHGR